MVTVYLKNGKNIQVPLEDLEDFIYANQDKIETRFHQRRGERRGDVPSNDTATRTSTSNR
jgi:hypothetical protein